MARSSTSVFPFPSSDPHLRSSASVLSIASRLSTQSTRATALEVYDIVYGQAPHDGLERLYEDDAVYENPLITASCREMIGEVHGLARKFSQIEVPRPLTLLSTIFHLKPVDEAESWFRALNVWSEIEDVCESESFEGHRTSIIEHHVHVLLLPGLHNRGSKLNAHWSESTDSLDNLASVANLPLASHVTPSSSLLALSSKALSLPSPFHNQLRVVTRLSFNEQGRIIHHRDIWDLRDVVSLIPGASTAQWFASRLFAHGLTLGAKLASHVLPSSGGEHSFNSMRTIEHGGSVISARSGTGSRRAFNVRGVGSESTSEEMHAYDQRPWAPVPSTPAHSTRAPDVDRAN